MRTWGDRIERTLGPALIDKVPRDHQQPDSEFRKRRVVVGIVLVVGAVLLGFSLATAPGNALFYWLTLAVAATWVVGGLLSGPLHLGYTTTHNRLHRPLVTPLLIGLAASGVFLLGALIVREIPPLRDYVANVLAHAQQGTLALIILVTVVNGAAEEVFFRGALFAAIGRKHPVMISTIVYAIAMIATGNPMLVFAAITLGTVWGLQRRASGGILASTITHLTWSMVMLLALPPLLHV